MSLINPDIPESGSIPVTHRAGRVLVDPGHILENGFVKTHSGEIIEVGQGRGHAEGGRIIDHGPGVLMPGLVNAHTHLELSALKNQTDFASGFISWIQSVIEKREAAGKKHLIEGIFSGIEESADSGTLLVGDIASLGLSRQPFLNSKLSGVLFSEYLGPDTRHVFECGTLSQEKILSVAGHAPHTTATSLLVRLKSVAGNHGLPFSLHLAESHDEVEFLTTGKGGWADFLKQRKIDTSAIKLTGAGPVKYADQLGILDDRTLAVHLVFADKNDCRILADKNVNVCLCPRSNRFLHAHLPDLPLMLKSGLKLCLGTDSLASNDSLSLFDEMKFLSQSFAGISPKEILAMATINGAEALGFENRFGRLTPGRSGKMIYLSIETKTSDSLLESIVSANFNEKIKSIF